MTKHQWLILILCESILLCNFYVHPSLYMGLLFLLLQLEFLAVRKAVYIKNSLFTGAIFIRRTTYLIPYMLSLPFLESKVFVQSYVWMYYFIAIFIGACLILPRIQQLKNLYNKELIMMFPPITCGRALIEIYTLIASAVFQELFYRVFLISVLYPIVGIATSILMSAVFFVAEHALHPISESSFKLDDHIFQFIMSIAAGILFMSSGSLLVPILIHLTYNMSIGLSYIIRILYSIKSVERN